MNVINVENRRVVLEKYPSAYYDSEFQAIFHNIGTEDKLLSEGSTANSAWMSAANAILEGE